MTTDPAPPLPSAFVDQAAKALDQCRALQSSAMANNQRELLDLLLVHERNILGMIQTGEMG